VLENLFPSRPPTRDIGRVDTKAERTQALQAISDYAVQPPNLDADVSTLSGGNAQKVVLARSLVAKPRVLVLEDPTLGVDIGARAQIHGLISDACQAGMAVVLVSSDFEEVASLAHRVFVVRNGAIARELKGDEVDSATLPAIVHRNEPATTGADDAVAEVTA
jgi:ABC-type sugar transport system ATPase subunit